MVFPGGSETVFRPEVSRPPAGSRPRLPCLHLPAGCDQRLAKRVQLRLGIIRVKEGLSYFFTQQLRVAPAQAMNQRFQSRQAQIQCPCTCS
jgi:hypothetical protein